MARIIVRRPVQLGSLVVDHSGTTVWGEGLDQIEPTVIITPVVKAAFAAGASRVHLKGDALAGDFVRDDDWVELEQRNGRLVALHFVVYTFQGWKPF